jgi:hypothetical protein
MRRLTTGVMVLGMVGSSLACQTRPAATLPSPRVGLRLTTAKTARQLSRQRLHVDIPFALAEGGLSGTGIVMAFLQRMQVYRVSYVSDLSYSLQLTYNGADIECVSKITVDDGSPPEPAPAAAPDEDEADYTTTVKPWRPRTSSAWVVDRDMVCEQHAQQVAAATPVYENRYNAEISRRPAPGFVKMENTQIVYYDECTYQPHRRFVHRYEHFVVARFSPPDVEAIRRSYADLPLIHEPPLCHEIKRVPGQPLRQHIDAEVYFPAEIVPDRENEIRIQAPVPQQGGER